MKSHQPHVYVYSSFVNNETKKFSIEHTSTKQNYSYLAMRYKYYACCDFKKSIHRWNGQTENDILHTNSNSKQKSRGASQINGGMGDNIPL
ncbi:hypothetical protein JHK82_032358 [Glycine max]|nr:hypothetical protein JHK85_033032 [Glycine max]KAG5125621.1 hypothetical protein JHK82_032358 [Glycine max]